jgi:hypothetical protein
MIFNVHIIKILISTWVKKLIFVEFIFLVGSA